MIFSCITLLQEICTREGMRCLFLPKFHCELNYIEMYWGAANKRYTRENCGYTFAAGLKVMVPKALDQVSSLVVSIRKYERLLSSFRLMMDAYSKKGLTSRQALFAVKKYTSPTAYQRARGADKDGGGAAAG